MRAYKFLATCLVVILLSVTTLVGCTTSESTTSPTTTAGPATDSSPEPEEVIKLKYSSPALEVEPSTMYGYYFCDYVEEHSGGRVQIERFPGGVLGSSMEHLELVRSGSVDIASFIIPLFPQELPLSGYNFQTLGSRETAVEDWYDITFNIPETAALVQEEQEQQNIKILNWHAVGVQGIITRESASSLADLEGKKVGVIMEDKALESMGLYTVGIEVTEMYESLSRGVVDALSMSLSAMAMLGWHELGKSYMTRNTFNVGQPIVVNLEMWNDLPSDIQQIFLEAAQASMEYSLELDEQITNDTLQIFSDAGLSLEGIPEDEQQELFEAGYRFINEDWLAICEQVGVAEEAEILMEYIEEKLMGE